MTKYILLPALVIVVITSAFLFNSSPVSSSIHMNAFEHDIYNFSAIEKNFEEQLNINESIENTTVSDIQSANTQSNIDTSSTQSKNTSTSIQNKNTNISESKNTLPKGYIGVLKIKSINLVANVKNGVDMDTLNEALGHFNDTKTWTGNIGLCGHNRGYKVNYFANLHKVKINDEIVYITEYGERTYKVESVNIIADDDWSMLGNTSDNRITLITCINNDSSKRLCVQAVEI